jgi:hypothetical protein
LHKFDSHVPDSSGKCVCGISCIGNVFQADFSSAQSSLRCLISQSSSKLWKWHRRLGHLKRGNLDKFESRSFDGILLGYIPHGRSY